MTRATPRPGKGRKVKRATPIVRYAVVRDNGDICTGTIEKLKANARYWLKHNAYQKGTARVARLTLSEVKP